MYPGKSCQPIDIRLFDYDSTTQGPYYKQFQPSLMFASMVGVYLSEAAYR
jgi:hypothetical protein